VAAVAATVVAVAKAAAVAAVSVAPTAAAVLAAAVAVVVAAAVVAAALAAVATATDLLHCTSKRLPREPFFMPSVFLRFRLDGSCRRGRQGATHAAL
jgi:hypothetical protein